MQTDRKERPWAPGASPAYWLNQASRALLRRHEARLRLLGLGMGHLPVLFALEDGGALSQKELAARARVEQPTMAEMLARMEKLGLVERTPNPDDKRGTLTSLTRKARARVPKAKSELMLGEDEALKGLSAKEKTLLRALLQRVVTNLDEAPPVDD